MFKRLNKFFYMFFSLRNPSKKQEGLKSESKLDSQVKSKFKTYTYNKQSILGKAQSLTIDFNPFLLIGCQLINIAPLGLELTWWMLSILVICLLWQIDIAQKRKDKPNKWVVTVLAVSGCLLLAFSGKSLGLLSTMIHLLVLSYVLKAFEQRTRADFYQIVLLGIFVVTSSFIFQQSIYFTIAIAIILVVNLIQLISVFSPSQSVRAYINAAVKLFLLSVPLTVVLFIGFPKLSPLWEVPTAKSSKTGLSDSVKVGDIAKLALSNKLAFRVTFTDSAPQYSQLYWRAIVMEHFDGRAWQAKIDAYEFKNSQFKENVDFSEQGKSINYQVIVSPTYQKWLFGLDVARVNKRKTKGLEIVHRQDYSLLSLKPVSQTSSYSLTSFVESPLALEITRLSKRKNLFIPKESNPRLFAKAHALKEQFPDKRELIQQVLATFTKEQYRYTLKPPQLTNNSLDEFYFDTQAGFCEHYASSFTFMMRAAGIPARMVTGYMGGEYNPQGGYFSVYQRDAHAWSEVWLAGSGWVRVDPTAAINPERVERGFSESLLSEYENFTNDGFSLLGMSSNALVNQIRFQLEALDYNWTRWVVGYSSDKQNRFLQELALTIFSVKNLPWKTLLTYTFALITLFFIVRSIVRIRKLSQPVSAESLYHTLVLAMEEQGMSKPKKHTPQDLNEAVKIEHPHLSLEFSQFTQLYLAIMYQKLTLEEKAIALALLKKSFQIINNQINSYKRH